MDPDRVPVVAMRITRLGCYLWLALLIHACHPAGPKFASSELGRIKSDELVDDWRVSGETGCPDVVQATDGCYVLEVKYQAKYTYMAGGSSFWGLGTGAAIDALAQGRIHESEYETGYVPFALQLHPQHSYYVTATFDGDKFMPRIVETNAAAERTREISPARSLEELEQCKAHGPKVSAADQDVCRAPAPATAGRSW
jgi:hypothetical protein